MAGIREFHCTINFRTEAYDVYLIQNAKNASNHKNKHFSVAKYN